MTTNPLSPPTSHAPDRRPVACPRFGSAVAAAALAAGMAVPARAAIIVDPGSIGATDITDLNGDPLDPTVGLLTPDGLVVGFDGDGELLIDNITIPAAVLSSAGRIGNNTGSTGKVTVSGGAWNTGVTSGTFGGLAVGYEGTGELMIRNGGAVFSDFGRIAELAESTGEVTVTGSFSKWENSASLTVGEFGAGQLTVLDGGKVTSAHSGIGDGNGLSLDVSNEVRVSGVDALGNASAWDITGVLIVGNSKPGKLTIEDGGVVTAASDTFVGSSLVFNELLGEVVVDGIHADGTRSLLETTAGGNLTIGNVSKGIMTVTDGARVVTASTGKIGEKFGNSFGDGQVTVSGVHANGTASSWEVGSFRVGSASRGRLTVDGGAQVTGNDVSSIGNGSSGDGEVTITGDGSAWTQADILFVGDSGGIGKLTVSDGGAVTAVASANVGTANGTGDVVVTGADSKLEITGNGRMRLGRSHIGTMTVADGGRVTHDGNGTIGETALGTGTATVDGSGSHWEMTGSAFLLVGEEGVGSLTLSDQGRVSNHVGEIGVVAGSDGEVTVNGAGSLWDNRSTLFVGDAGSGKLNIDAGGEVRYGTTTAFVGNSAGSSGEILVTGAGSTLNGGGKLTLGENSGSATVTVSDGGQVSVPDLRIGSFDASVDSSVFVRGDGARLNLTNDLVIQGSENGWLAVSDGGQLIATDAYIGGNANNGGGDGRLELSGAADTRVELAGDLKIWRDGVVSVRGGTLAVDTIDRTSGGTFDLLGGTLQAERFEGDLLNQAGRVAPGPGTGSTLVVGDFTQDGNGTLAIDIGTNGAHDLVQVTGAADVDGLLALTLGSGAAPAGTDTIPVLVADSLIGIFDNAINGQRLTTTDGAGSFVVNYGLGSAFDVAQIVLSDFMAPTVLTGDYNGSGLVEQGDLDLVLQNWGDGFAGLPTGWASQRPAEGIVDQAELDGVLQHWGSAAAPNFRGSAAPEPGTLALLGLGGLAMLPRRR